MASVRQNRFGKLLGSKAFVGPMVGKIGGSESYLAEQLTVKATVENEYGEKENAWTNALEFAIVKAGAQGKSTDKDALAAITKYLHSGHGLTYDTCLGSPRFISGAGGGVMRLTDYIAEPSSRYTSIVNCYDQAGGLCCLGALLGVGAEYVYMNPFGYINTVDLVGVGACNNPFFENKTEPYGTSALVGTDLTLPDRSGFGNHAFAMLGGSAFDSCAGPVCGVNVLQYKLSTIDTSTPAEATAAMGGRIYYVGETCITPWYQVDVTGVTDIR